MQQLEEEGSRENITLWRTLQNGGRAERRARISSGIFQTSRKLAAHPLTGIILIALFLGMSALFLAFRRPSPDNNSLRPQSKAVFPTKTGNAELILKKTLEDQKKQFQSAKNKMETRLKFLEERNQNLTRQVECLETYKALSKPGKFNLTAEKQMLYLLYNSKKVENCGGSFEIWGEPSLFQYEKPATNTLDDGQPCFWVVWTLEASKMKARMLHLRGEVTIYEGFGSNQTIVAGFQNWSNDPLREIVLESNVAVVLFTPKKQNHSLSQPTRDMMTIDFRFANDFPPLVGSNVSMTTLTADTSTPLHIQRISGHEHDQRNFTFIYPSANRRVHLEIKSVNTEAPHDFLSVFKYSNDARQFEFVRKFQGQLGVHNNGTFEGYTNQPILLYYHTDETVNSEGYRATYSSKI